MLRRNHPGWTLNPKTGVLSEEEAQTHRERNTKMVAEIETMFLKAKERQGLQEQPEAMGEAGNRIPSRSSGRGPPCSTLIWDAQPPER